MLKVFFKNVATLAAGTAFAQIIVILATPILSRLYTPEEFGAYGIFITVVGLLSTIAALGYDMAIVKEDKEEDAYHLFQTCVLISFSSSFIFFLLSQIFSDAITMSFIAFVPLGMFFYAVNNSIYSLLNRYELYAILSKVQVLRSIIIIALQTACGFLGFIYYGLVLGVLISALAVGIYGYSQLIANQKIRSNISKNSVKKLLNKNIDFARYGVPQNIVGYFSSNSPIFILSIYFNMVTVGAYFFAVKLVQMPANFIGASVKRVFYRKAHTLRSDLTSLSELYNKMTITMIAIISPIATLWFIYAEIIFPMVFGEGWMQAAVFSKWLLIMFGANFVGAPTRALFIVFNIQKYLLIIDTCEAIIKLVVIIIMAQYFSAVTVVITYSLLSALTSFCFIFGWFLYFLRQRAL